MASLIALAARGCRAGRARPVRRPWHRLARRARRSRASARRAQPRERAVRAVLALVRRDAAVWAVGLVAIDISYEAGQVDRNQHSGACSAPRRPARRPGALHAVAGRRWSAIVLLALLKSGAFDWDELGDGAAAATSLLVVACALLASGFASRWANPAERLAGRARRARRPAPLPLWRRSSRSVACSASSLEPRASRRGGRRRGGRRRRRCAVPPAASRGIWSRGSACSRTGTGRSDSARSSSPSARSCFEARPARSLSGPPPAARSRSPGGRWPKRGSGWPVSRSTGATAVGSLALVTAPSRLVDASAHPASGLWALAVVVWRRLGLALTTPPFARLYTQEMLADGGGVDVVRVLARRARARGAVSRASVETDFQRGHTALSALWGIGALALYVFGLARDRRDLRVVGLALFGLALAKLFLYDLATSARSRGRSRSSRSGRSSSPPASSPSGSSGPARASPPSERMTRADRPDRAGPRRRLLRARRARPRRRRDRGGDGASDTATLTALADRLDAVAAERDGEWRGTGDRRDARPGACRHCRYGGPASARGSGATSDERHSC